MTATVTTLPPRPTLVLVRCFHDDGTGVRTVNTERPVYPAERQADGSLREMTWAEFHEARAKALVNAEGRIASTERPWYFASVSIYREQAKLRAIIYLRLSVGGREESTSMEKMERDCRARCASEGFEVIEVLKDDGLSGGVRRAKADHALKMLRSNDADLLMVWKFDRWSRQGIIAVGDLMETLLKTAPRTRFIAIMDGLDSVQPFFPLMASFFAEQARIERENIKFRVTGTVELLASQGRYYGGITPFGWKQVANPNGPGYVLGLHPEQHPVLREIVDRVIVGEPVHAITRDFNERLAEMPKDEARVLSPEGVGWNPNTMRRLLRNPILRGMVGFHSDHKKGEYNLVLGDDNLPIRPNHAAVSDEDWYALQQALDARSYKVAGFNRDGHLLKGLAVCDACGKNLARRAHHLACSRHRKDFACPGCIIDREKTETLVSKLFIDRYGDLPVMVEVEVEQDASRVREIVEALDVVGRRYLAAETEEEERKWTEMKWDLRRELKALETTVNSGPSIVREEMGRTYAEEWEGSTIDQRRELLMSHVREVRITKSQGKRMWDPTRVQVRWIEDEAMDAFMDEEATA